MTTQTAPRVQRTSLFSACGASWKCRPRSVCASRAVDRAALDEPRRQPVLGELALAEHAREVAALVAAPLDVDDRRVRAASCA